MAQGCLSSHVGEANPLLLDLMKDSGAISSKLGTPLVWDTTTNPYSTPSVTMVHSGEEHSLWCVGYASISSRVARAIDSRYYYGDGHGSQDFP